MLHNSIDCFFTFLVGVCLVLFQTTIVGHDPQIYTYAWSLHGSFYRKRLLNINSYDTKLHIQCIQHWRQQSLYALKFQTTYFTLATNSMWLSEECLNLIHFGKHASRFKGIRSPLYLTKAKDWLMCSLFFLKFQSCLLILYFWIKHIIKV